MFKDLGVEGELNCIVEFGPEVVFRPLIARARFDVAGYVPCTFFAKQVRIAKQPACLKPSAVDERLTAPHRFQREPFFLVTGVS